jgi:hypothetical protein
MNRSDSIRFAQSGLTLQVLKADSNEMVDILLYVSSPFRRRF